MRKIILKIIALFSVFACLGLTSCLENFDMIEDLTETSVFIESENESFSEEEAESKTATESENESTLDVGIDSSGGWGELR
ncbi:MAG: hypothetical protein IJS67_00475 [Clostridia bacterium]|nr:hypothetical protein [Clostridia bacterium]